jgi:hypothetical protein
MGLFFSSEPTSPLADPVTALMRNGVTLLAVMGWASVAIGLSQGSFFWPLAGLGFLLSVSAHRAPLAMAVAVAVVGALAMVLTAAPHQSWSQLGLILVVLAHGAGFVLGKRQNSA